MKAGIRLWSVGLWLVVIGAWTAGPASSQSYPVSVTGTYPYDTYGTVGIDRQMGFYVTNQGDSTVTMKVSCGANSYATCSLTTPGDAEYTATPGSSTEIVVDVTFTSGSIGAQATVTLDVGAYSQPWQIAPIGEDSYTYDFELSPAHRVDVIANQPVDNGRAPGDAFGPYAFAVKNTGGSVADNISASCGGTDGVNCQSAPLTSANLDSGESTTYQASGSFDWDASMTEYVWTLASVDGTSASASDSTQVTLTNPDSIHVTFRASESQDWIGKNQAGTMKFAVTSPWDFEVKCIGPTGGDSMGCSVPSSSYLAGTRNIDVQVTESSTEGSQSVWLVAGVDLTSLTAPKDSGQASYAVYDPTPGVTVENGPDTVDVNASGQVHFEVSTSVPENVTYTLDVWHSPEVTTTSPSSPIVLNDSSTLVAVPFTAVDTGTAQVRLTASTTAGGGATSSASATHTFIVRQPTGGSVSVTPDSATATVAAATTQTASFQVAWSDDSQASFNLSVDCGPDLSGCTIVGPNPLTVPADSSEVVEVSYTSGDLGTDANEIKLTATQVGGLATDFGTWLVTSTSLSVTVDDANPGLEEVRSECVRAAAGPGAIRCDDYEYAHFFAPLKRLNRDRTLGLFYNSSTSEPRKIIGANVFIPEGTPDLTRVVAHLRIASDTVDSLVFDEAALNDERLKAGQTTRIAFALDDALSPEDALVDYNVLVRAWDDVGDTLPSVEASGTFIQLDHSEEFGKGWWVTGYERIVPPGAASEPILWVGGSASARAYVPVDSATTWVAYTRGRPDTLVQAPSSDTASYLDLSSDDRAAAANHTGVTGGTQKTWAFWIRPHSYGGRFAGVHGGGTNPRSWWLSLDSSTGQLRMALDVNTTHVSALTADSGPALDQWSFVVVEFDGSGTSDADRLKMWINGIAQNVTKGGAAVPGSLTSTSGAAFAIGRATIGVPGLDGDLGQFAVIEGLLGASTRAEWRTTGIDFGHAGLVAGYKWEGSTNDQSAAGHDLAPDSTLDYGTTTAYSSRGEGGAYVRKLLGGGEVHYSATGRHLKTVDRNGNETRFLHEEDLLGTHTRLMSVDLPTAEGPEVAYEFEYDTTDAALPLVRVSVIGPPDTLGAATWLDYAIGTESVGMEFTLDTIIAPDGVTYAFDYDTGGDGLLESITDHRSAVTRIAYTAQKVDSVWTTDSDVVDPSFDPVHVQYRAASTVGVSLDTTTQDLLPQPKDSLSAVIDGPRQDVGDVTTFFVNGWGAVRGVRDAEDYETWIERGDGRWPALPTEVKYPNGWIRTASYDAVGLLDSLTSNISDPPASTTFQWDPALAQVTQITSPEGVVTHFAYDGVGNRIREWVANDTVRYSYTGFGAVETITDAEDHVTTLAYDSTYGNLSSQRTPLGITVHWERDATGRPIKTLTPVRVADADTIFQVDSVAYDIMGRETFRSTWSTSSDSTDNQWVHVFTEYDGSTKDRIEVRTSADAPVDTMSLAPNTWTYDGLGRVLTETGAATDRYFYDPAGNVVKQMKVHPDSSTGPIVYDTLKYNARNQLTERIMPARSYEVSAPAVGTDPNLVFPYYESTGLTVPGDTAAFTYDEMGNMRTAVNAAASITRTYEKDGLVKTDQTQFKSPAWGSATFLIQSGYNEDRQRTTITHPSPLGGGTTTYSYDPQTGRLSSVNGPASQTYGFTYNRNGQLLTKTFMGSGRDSVAYSVDGQLSSRILVAGSDTLLWYPTFSYDLRDKLVSVGQMTAEYTDLGHLRSLQQPLDGPITKETFAPNGLGFSLRDEIPPRGFGTTAQTLSGSGIRTSIFNSRAGQLGSQSGVWPSPEGLEQPNDWIGLEVHREYERGNLMHDWRRRELWDLDLVDPGELETPNPYKLADFYDESRSYYSADDKLVVHQANRDSVPASATDSLWRNHSWGGYEEYVYDALGRRIAKRSRQQAPLCDVAAFCENSVEWTIWDGDQILWETRARNGSSGSSSPSPGTYSGRIGYVHVFGVDAPVGLVRNGTAVALHANWRGLYAFGTDSNGDELTDDDIEWPGVDWTARLSRDARLYPQWYGSLVRAGRDDSGLAYRRNRYYDPQAAQFTQEDPIGIAGGLNLYGYANGDPVNFSDPFGLCVPLPQCALAAAGAGARGGTLVGGALGSLFPGVGTLTGAAIGRAAGVVLVGGAAAIAGSFLLMSENEGRSLDDPGSLEGASPEEVAGLVPDGWTEQPSRTGGGTRYSNPDATGEQIRIMPGDPRAPTLVKQGPYAVISKDGQRVRIPLRGNPVLEERR